MGTPEFAVPSLEALIEAGKNIVGVITAEDKPQGRGLKPAPSAVKACALRHGLNVLQPSNLKAPEFIEALKSLEADIQVVVAFRMLPEVVWAMPSGGTFNLHASLLPQYRGAAPINWAIINGETETGVTTFFLQHQIDTGNIIFQEREPIAPNDTVGTLYNRLMLKGANLVVKTIDAIENGVAVARPQVIPASLKHAPKIFKENCLIHWQLSTEAIRNFIRGLSPYPAAWTTIHGKSFKVFEAVTSNRTAEGHPGDLYTDNTSTLAFKTADGWLEILEFQPEGKKRMRVSEFFLGNKL